MESSHQPRQPGKLHWLPNGQTGQHREHAQDDHGRVSMLLKGVVGPVNRGLWPEEKIMFHHRPHSRDVARREQNLAVIPAEELIAEVDQARSDVNPHEGEMPLQGATEPSTDGQRLRPVQQIFLRNLGAKARKRSKDLQAAADQNEQRNRVSPVTDPYRQGMLVGGPSYSFGLF